MEPNRKLTKRITTKNTDEHKKCEKQPCKALKAGGLTAVYCGKQIMQ